MDTVRPIDITFDFRSDTPQGTDPDVRSPTLRRYHKLLWSKLLPSGALLDLSNKTPGIYLHHRSDQGEFRLASDTVIPSFRKERRLAHILGQNSTELDDFNSIIYTIGGMMLFPSNRIDRKMTINGARGFHPLIKDRFDLTVECIRRYYRNEDHPLSGPINRYVHYFNLFGDFRGFAEFFLLHDLVTDDFKAVRFFMPFDDFRSSPVPNTMADYMNYRASAIEFVRARNQRILTWADCHRPEN